MIKKIIIITLIAITALILTILVIVNSVHYDDIANNFSNKLNIAPQNLKNIRIINFPLPHLVIDYIKEEKRFELENIELHFDLLSILILKPKIGIVKINNAKIHSNENYFNVINHDQIVSLFITSDIVDTNFIVKSISIINERDQPIVTLSNFFLQKDHPLSNKAIFKGNVARIGQISGFFKKTDKQTDFDVTITNNDYNFHFTETYINSKLINGNGEYLIQNLANILHDFIPDLDSVFRKINKDEKLTIKFDILPTEQLLKLENVTIHSKAFEGKGLIYLSKGKNISSIINLAFAKIDAGSLISPSKDITQLNNSAYGLRLIFGNKSILTNISAEQIILSNNEILTNTKLLLDLENGVLVVKDFSGLINSGGVFKFAGNILQNSVRSIFEGTVFLQHSDLNSVLSTLGYQHAISKKPTPFSLSSDLKLTLIDVYLQNLLLENENTKVTGNITARFIGFMPHFITNLEFSPIDLNRDDYPVISPLVKYIKSLSENMNDAQYLTKYIPIRTIDYLGNFDITINDTFIGNNSLGKIYILANLSPSNVEISNLDIRKASNYINLSANLLASSIRPLLNIRVNDGSFTVNSLTPGSLLALRNKLLDKFDSNKIELKLNCALSKITQNELILQNITLSLENNNSLFKITNLEAELLSGKLKAGGNILLDPYTINFVYAFNSIDLAKLSAILPTRLPSSTGKISINGSLHTIGDSMEQLLYELNIQSKFIAKNVKITNFSIDSLIEKLNSQNYNSKYLKDDLAYATSQGQTDVNSFNSSLELKNGIITMKDAAFNTRYSAGSASLAINIYNFQIALSSILSFYLTESVANSTDQHKNIPVNLKIQGSGTIFDLIKVPDATDIIKVLDSRKKQAS
jgi:hypothetical protein